MSCDASVLFFSGMTPELITEIHVMHTYFLFYVWRSLEGDCNFYTLFAVNAPVTRMVYYISVRRRQQGPIYGMGCSEGCFSYQNCHAILILCQHCSYVEQMKN